MAGADIQQFVKGLAEARKRAEEACLKALDKFGEHVVGDAAELAPVKTGALKASATTLPAEYVGTDIAQKVIGFGVDYAAPVHERLSAQHEQGQAKFLEAAMKADAPKMAPYVSAAVRGALDEHGAMPGAGGGGSGPAGAGGSTSSGPGGPGRDAKTERFNRRKLF